MLICQIPLDIELKLMPRPQALNKIALVVEIAACRGTFSPPSGYMLNSYFSSNQGKMLFLLNKETRTV